MASVSSSHVSMLNKFTLCFGHFESSWSPGPHHLHNNCGISFVVQSLAKCPQRLHAWHCIIGRPLMSYYIRLRPPLLLLPPRPRQLLLQYPPEVLSLFVFVPAPAVDTSCVSNTCWCPFVFILNRHSSMECPTTGKYRKIVFSGRSPLCVALLTICTPQIPFHQVRILFQILKFLHHP